MQPFHRLLISDTSNGSAVSNAWPFTVINSTSIAILLKKNHNRVLRLTQSAWRYQRRQDSYLLLTQYSPPCLTIEVRNSDFAADLLQTPHEPSRFAFLFVRVNHIDSYCVKLYFILTYSRCDYITTH